MDSEMKTVLLVEDDINYAQMIDVILSRAKTPFELVHVERLSDAFVRLVKGGIDAVLLDLTLPDAQGLDTFDQINAAVPALPVIVLSGLDDESIATQAMQQGAQDYLVKGKSDLRWLPRSIGYAIERELAHAERNQRLEQLAILRDVDEDLTHRLDLDYVLMMGLDAAVRLSLASAGMIALFEGGEVRHLQNINYDPEVLDSFPFLEEGIVGRALRNRRAECVVDALNDPDYVALLPRTRAQIVIPLVAQGHVIGFLNLEANDPARFTEETFSFIKLLAARVAVAVDNAHLYQTAQKQLAELQGLYAHVSTLEQMKTDIIRIATHDLRTPLNSVIGFAHLLKLQHGAALPNQAHEYVAFIEKSADRIREITDDILSLERVEEVANGTTELVDMQALIERAYQNNRDLASQKKQRLALAMTSSPIRVRGQGALLYEAVNNLIHNAIKYTPEGGYVEVRLQRNAHTATFKVLDTGYGVPEDQQRRLFQPFFRVQSDEIEVIDGTGLGLHLVKNIISRHDGQMMFKSVHGEGSTFGFRLPLAETAVVA